MSLLRQIRESLHEPNEDEEALQRINEYRLQIGRDPLNIFDVGDPEAEWQRIQPFMVDGRDAWTIDALGIKITRPRHHGFVATLPNGKEVGWLELYDPEASDRPANVRKANYVRDIMVEDDYRHMGIATALYRAAHRAVGTIYSDPYGDTEEGASEVWRKLGATPKEPNANGEGPQWVLKGRKPRGT